MTKTDSTVTVWDPPQTVNDIRSILNDDRCLERAVVVLYLDQTASERMTKRTKLLNGSGFSVTDAPIGTYLAKHIITGLKSGKKYGENLTGEWLDKARKIAPKYAGQLLQHARLKQRQTQLV